MTIAKLTALMIGGVLALGYITVGYDPRWLLVRWTDATGASFTATGRLEIATAWRPLKSASASLLCGPDGSHLMVKARLPIPSEFGPTPGPKVGYGDRSELMASTSPYEGTYRSLVMDAQLAVWDSGPVDTMMTAALNPVQMNALIALYSDTRLPNLTFHTLETMIRLSRTAPAQDVSSFLRHCAGITARHQKLPAAA